MTTKLTTEYRKRIIDAIAQTQKQIDRELKYQEQFQDKAFIAVCQKHMANLQQYLVDDCFPWDVFYPELHDVVER